MVNKEFWIKHYRGEWDWANWQEQGHGGGREEGGIDRQCCGPLPLPCMCNDPNYPSESPSPTPHPQTTEKHSTQWQTEDIRVIVPKHAPLQNDPLRSLPSFSFPSPVSVSLPSSRSKPMNGCAGYLIIATLFQPHMVVEDKSPPFFLQVETESPLCCNHIPQWARSIGPPTQRLPYESHILTKLQTSCVLQKVPPNQRMSVSGPPRRKYLPTRCKDLDLLMVCAVTLYFLYSGEI